MAMAQFSSDSIVIHYVLPALWVTSCLHITIKNRWCKTGVYSKRLTRVRVWCLQLPCQVLFQVISH